MDESSGIVTVCVIPQIFNNRPGNAQSTTAAVLSVQDPSTDNRNEISPLFKEGISITWMDNFCGRLINAWHCISLKLTQKNGKRNVRVL